MPEAPALEREAERALLLTSTDELLLLQYLHPDRGHTFWITPGGGREAGEGAADCLRRELYEETGLESVALGPPVWNRVHEFTWAGQRYRQRERFYLITIDRFEPCSRRPDALEAEAFRGFRWWSVDDIAAASTERFAPRLLGGLVRQLLEEGPGPAPLEIPV